MNERNTEALAGMLRDDLAGVVKNAAFRNVVSRHVAARLASRGVLAPIALTDEQATSFPFDGEFIAIGEEDLASPAAKRRTALERIAKGEA
jgi:hypothetical protein